MTKEQREEIIKDLEQCSYSYVGNNSQKSFALREDAKVLAQRIIDYFEQYYPKVNFKDFYDKPFLDTMKYIIKNEELFYHFLEAVQYRNVIRDFFTSAVYICPQVFTSSVNRFIREHYDLSQSQQ